MELRSLTVDQFVAEVASGNPTPGGGSVGALCGALGAALAHMVCGLTLGREKFMDAREDLEPVSREAAELQQRFSELVQQDTDAYQNVLKAFGLPKQTEQDRRERLEAVQKAMKGAATVPLETLRTASKLIGCCEKVLRKGNPSTLTDAGVAAQVTRAAATAAAYNVRINLGSIRDEDFVAAYRSEVELLMGEIEKVVAACDRLVSEKL